MADRNDTLLFVHQFAPPWPGGTPVVMRRLLTGLGPQLVTLTSYRQRRDVRRGARAALPGRYVWCLTPPHTGAMVAPIRWTGTLLSVALGVLAGLQGAWLARRVHARWILSVADSGFSQLAGGIAARLSRRPHLIAVFDPWEENAYADSDRLLARMIEGPLWRDAAQVVVLSRELGHHYRSKHGANVLVLPTPLEAAPPPPEPHRDEDVLVTGAVYWMQEEAVRRILRAARRAGLRTTLLGDERELRAHGFEADRFEPALPADEFRARLRRAGMLAIGVAFGTAYPVVVRGSTPARYIDYMGSGVPMVVHAPPGTYVAEYARAEDFAEVVDAPDEAALAEAFRRVATDQRRSAARAERARRLAVRRHDPEAVRAKLRSALDRLSREGL